MAKYTLHVNFEAEDDEDAVDIGEWAVEQAARMMEVSLSETQPLTYGWDVSGVDEGGNLDWSTIIRR